VRALDGGPEDGPEGVGVDAGLDGQLEGGRKFTACWLPLRASWLGQGRGHLVTDGDESSTATTRSLNVSLS
jgi:hypothetical protein